jgi:hypothetical protein
MSWSEKISAGDWPATIQSVAGTIVIAVFVVTFLVQAFTIPRNPWSKRCSSATTCWWISFATAAAGVEPSAALSQRPARRHHRLPLPGESRAGLREARRGVARRPPASHQQARLHQRRPGRGALYAVHHHGLRNSYRDDFPRTDSPDYAVDAKWWKEMPKLVEDHQLIIPEGHYFVWATIAMTARTAAIGDSCRAKISSDARS